MGRGSPAGVVSLGRTWVVTAGPSGVAALLGVAGGGWVLSVGAAGAAVAVADGVVELVTAKIMGVRRVRDRAVRVDGHRAVRALGDADDGEHVGGLGRVVGQHVDRDRRVLVGRGGVGVGDRVGV